MTYYKIWYILNKFLLEFLTLKSWIYNFLNIFIHVIKWILIHLIFLRMWNKYYKNILKIYINKKKCPYQKNNTEKGLALSLGFGFSLALLVSMFPYFSRSRCFIDHLKEATIQQPVSSFPVLYPDVQDTCLLIHTQNT